MIKKSIFLGVVLLCLTSIISCEKDFQETGVNIIGNPSFAAKDTTIYVTINPKDIKRIRTDIYNVKTDSLKEYLLGVYNKSGYKTITASIVSQLGFVENLKNKENGYTYEFAKAFLILPYASKKVKNSSYEITVLGDSLKNTLKVYRNETQLYSLDPKDPSKQKIYYSNEGSNYTKGTLLNTIKFTPKATTVKYPLEIAGKKDSITIANNAPFITVSLDSTIIKGLFWDKFGSSEFLSAEAFQNYFKGIHLEADKNLISLDLKLAFLAMYYTKTDKKSKTTSLQKYTLPFGVRTSIYTTSGSNTSNSSNFVIQGTAGSIAEINFLQGKQLQKLRNKNWLINNASLTFFVDSNHTTDIPNRLFLYKNLVKDKDTIPLQIADLSTRDKSLQKSFGKLNEKKYDFGVTQHISDLLKGRAENTTLRLKAYNVTDFNSTNIRNYNWNPRSVRLLNNNAANGERRAQLKIYYTEKK